MYKFVHWISPTFFHDLFETLSFVHQFVNRQAHNGDIFMTGKNSLQCGLRSVRYADAKSWNSIPSSIKLSTAVMIVCPRLDNFSAY